MHNPYRIETPFTVSFSGGRTSARMLHGILEAYDGQLPAGAHVLFCNTGKERPETLDFVERCSAEWSVPVTWLEFRRAPGPVTTDGRKVSCYGWEVVNYATASRNGRPFGELLATLAEFRRVAKGKDAVLPNPVQRFCTAQLKIRTMRRYMEWLGYTNHTESYRSAIGLRSDEPRRVARLTDNHYSGQSRSDHCGEPVFPLHEAGVDEAGVMAFWCRQPFDLRLKQHEGNCDLCFLKKAGKINAILSERPELADWWAEQERRTGAKFRNDRPGYALMLRNSQEEGSLFDAGEYDTDDRPCHCTD